LQLALLVADAPREVYTLFRVWGLGCFRSRV
jgi:hypothetical protein